MDETREAIEKAKTSFAELLLTDISTAMISLDISETTRNPETRDSERRVALQAYETINGFLLDAKKLTADDSARIAAALEPLRSRLHAIGLVPSETQANSKRLV